jgi:hypothetical protein
VRRKVSIASLLLAWICANGAMLDTVQVCAWARMFAGYVRVLPVGAAVRATLDPSRPCELCLAVARAKASEEREAPVAPTRSAEKQVLAVAGPAPVVFPCRRDSWPIAEPERAPARVEPVPVRPPRAQVA